MITKTVNFYVDLEPGWQDASTEYDFKSASNKVSGQVPLGWKRIKIVCELPCFGGSAEEGCAVTAATMPASGYVEQEGGGK